MMITTDKDGVWKPSWGKNGSWLKITEDGFFVHGRRIAFADELEKCKCSDCYGYVDEHSHN